MADDNAHAGGGTPASGNGAGNPDINELINIAVGKRVKKAVEKAMESLRGDLASVVKEAISQQPQKTDGKPQEGQSTAPGNPAQEQDRLTLKALQDQIQREQKARQDLESRLKDADKRARDMQIRAEVEKRFASKLGADNPALSLLMDSFYDVKKRVVDQNGVPHVKFKSKYGDDDDFKPLDEAMVDLFDKGGEFHHLVQAPSKANGLPPRSVQARGSAAQNGAHDPAQQQSALNHPIYSVVAQSLRAAGDADKAAGLEHVASVQIGSEK